MAVASFLKWIITEDFKVKKGMIMIRNKIQVGIIGTGFIGTAHIEALRRLPNIEVIALADTDQQTADQKASHLGVLKAYGDYTELLKLDSIESVHICTPNCLHFSMTKKAIEAGKHVICEKPLTVSLEEGKELVNLAEEKGVANAVHFNIRYYPLVQNLQQLIKAEKLGHIFAIHGSYLQDWLFYQNDYNWRLDSELSGTSRAVADIGSHWLDCIEFVSGLRIVEVFADFGTFYPIRKKPKKDVETYSNKVLKLEDYEDIKINTEDYASVLLHFNNGAHGVTTINQVAAGRKNRLFFEIDGSKEAVAWDSEIPNQMWIGKRESANQILMKDPSLMEKSAQIFSSFPGGHQEGFPDTSKHLFREFYNYIANGGYIKKEKPSFPTFKDGLREIRLCDAILKSYQTSAWVSVGEV